ncbi:hypothetical protein AYO44_01295 [Planctomycetaceae bacterium SCGC AG-212-F19]|nr:hypothetical protein AYO44_01295 [Planctomycetaceae bacterium SCGC AG-212-F19]
MSGGSSSAVGWYALLEPALPPGDLQRRPDDPRLGEVVEFWNGDPAALRPGRAVIVGFPQDEGVRRNGGRVGAAEAPREIRRWLYRLTPWDPDSDMNLAAVPPLDIGDMRVSADLEATQESLGEVIGELLRAGVVPIVLGGGHETAYGHYLGYVRAGIRAGVINIDAHLDVRPLIDGKGHSGSPFRQMLEHPTQPLLGRYSCLGAQPGSISEDHYRFALKQRCRIQFVDAGWQLNEAVVKEEEDWLLDRGATGIMFSIDADAFGAADVPGVSAVNPSGLPGRYGMDSAHAAGKSLHVRSFELVEIDPRFDRDGQSARWAARVVWNFLIGLAARRQL